MHALIALPPHLTVHVPQFPLLHEVGTFMPSFLHAAIMLLPSPTLHDLPPFVSLTCPMVMEADRRC